MAVTLHYITEEFVLRKVTFRVFPFLGKYTDENIVTQLDNLVKSIKLLKMVKKQVVVCDQALSMNAALRKLETISDLNNGSITWIDHKVNVALERTVNKQANVKAASDACRTISTNSITLLLLKGCWKWSASKWMVKLWNF